MPTAESTTCCAVYTTTDHQSTSTSPATPTIAPPARLRWPALACFALAASFLKWLRATAASVGASCVFAQPPALLAFDGASAFTQALPPVLEDSGPTVDSTLTPAVNFLMVALCDRIAAAALGVSPQGATETQANASPSTWLSPAAALRVTSVSSGKAGRPVALVSLLLSYLHKLDVVLAQEASAVGALPERRGNAPEEAANGTPERAFVRAHPTRAADSAPLPMALHPSGETASLVPSQPEPLREQPLRRHLYGPSPDELIERVVFAERRFDIAEQLRSPSSSLPFPPPSPDLPTPLLYTRAMFLSMCGGHRGRGGGRGGGKEETVTGEGGVETFLSACVYVLSLLARFRPCSALFSGRPKSATRHPRSGSPRTDHHRPHRHSLRGVTLAAAGKSGSPAPSQQQSPPLLDDGGASDSSCESCCSNRGGAGGGEVACAGDDAWWGRPSATGALLFGRIIEEIGAALKTWPSAGSGEIEAKEGGGMVDRGCSPGPVQPSSVSVGGRLNGRCCRRIAPAISARNTLQRTMPCL